MSYFTVLLVSICQRTCSNIKKSISIDKEEVKTMDLNHLYTGLRPYLHI